MKLELEIPGLPPTINAIGRMHWAVKVKNIRMWSNLILASIGSNRPATPFKKATLSLTRFSSFEPDYDNLVISFKACIDALVKAEVIASDKPSVIGQPTYLWEKASPKKGKIKITVEGQP